MANCNDEGQLRAYLDGELPAIERAAISEGDRRKIASGNAKRLFDIS